MKRVAVLAVLALLLAAVPTALLVQAQDAQGSVSVRPAPHASIVIEGNSEFTSENGVRSGNGTPGNPYVISDWVITQTRRTGILLENTTAHVIIERIIVAGSEASVLTTAECLEDCRSRAGVRLRHAENVTVRQARILHEHRGVSIEHSRGVLVHDVRLGVLGARTYPHGFGLLSTGVLTLESSNVTIRDAAIYDAGAPVLVAHSNEVTIARTTMENTVTGAVTLFGADNVTLSNSRLDEVFVDVSYRVGRAAFLGNTFQGTYGGGAYAAIDTARLSHTYIGPDVSGDMRICGNRFQVSAESGTLWLQERINAQVRGNLFENNSETLEVATNGTLTFERNRVTNSTEDTGILWGAMGATIQNNSFEKNEGDLVLRGPANATYNWWGAASGPNVNGDGPGTGDRLSIEHGANVTYDPWLTSPPQTGPSAVDCGVDISGEPGADIDPVVVEASADIHAETEVAP